MRRRRAPLIALGALVSLSMLAIVAPRLKPDDAVVLTAAGNNSFTFGISGKSVERLHPGATRYIQLTLANPYSHALKVTELKGVVEGSSRQACTPSARNIRIWAYSDELPVTVPRHSKKTVHSIPVMMPRSASPECAQTTFTIRLTGTAKKVG